MGSTDPNGEGDRVASTDAYKERLEEYRRKLSEAADENPTLGRKLDELKGKVQFLRSKLPPGWEAIIEKALPIAIQLLPKIAQGLRKSAQQIEAFALTMEVVKASTAKPDEVDELITDDEVNALMRKFRVDDLLLDLNTVPNASKTYSVMNDEIRKRWISTMELYSCISGMPRWQYRSVPEFIPIPSDPTSGRWVGNPTYQRLKKDDFNLNVRKAEPDGDGRSAGVEGTSKAEG